MLSSKCLCYLRSTELCPKKLKLSLVLLRYHSLLLPEATCPCCPLPRASLICRLKVQTESASWPASFLLAEAKDFCMQLLPTYSQAMSAAPWQAGPLVGAGGAGSCPEQQTKGGNKITF